MITFLGTGLLGSGFARALRKRGEDVHVWNRSAKKARALEAYGAKAFDDPAEAARGAARVHVVVSDDAAVDQVLERVAPALTKDTIVVDHTTTSPTGTKARVARWAERGVPFQHAPVFMGPQNALESTGIMLVSGDRARFDRLAPDLSKMTGKLAYLGPSPTRGAEMKLLGNLFLMFITTGLADVFALGKAMGVSSPDAAALFDLFNPGLLVPPRAKRMIEADFGNPSWELAMARKDARLMLEEAARGNGRMAVLPAIAQEMDRWIERGHAAEDWTVIARDSLTESGG